jgi:hypothetical protein
MPLPDQATIRQRAEEILRGEDYRRYLDVTMHAAGGRMPELAGMTSNEQNTYLVAVEQACRSAHLAITWPEKEA